MTSITEHVPRPQVEIEVLRRGGIATEHMNGIKGELKDNPEFISAIGAHMFDLEGVGKERVERETSRFPVLGGYLSVRYTVEGASGLEEMILTWSDQQGGNLEEILLRAFDYDHTRPDPRGQWGAITHRKLSNKGEGHGKVNINTQEAVDAVVSFRATYLQRPT
jgi:hypothetical protein